MGRGHSLFACADVASVIANGNSRLLRKNAALRNALGDSYTNAVEGNEDGFVSFRKVSQVLGHAMSFWDICCRAVHNSR
jgi:hypothetical protein